MDIDLNSILPPLLGGLGALLLVVLIVAAVQIVRILRQFTQTSESITRMTEAAEKEMTPVISGMASSTQSISSLIARVDRVASLFLVKLELLGSGADQVRDTATRVMKDPVHEIQSWIAGVKRGVDVFLGTRGKNGGGDSHG